MNHLSLGLTYTYTLSGLVPGTTYSVSLTSKSVTGVESGLLELIIKTNEIGKLIF